MERLFSPCNRLHDILESQGRLEELREQNPEPLQELNLEVSTEELVSAERVFTYADLYALLESGDTVAWLTPHAAIVCEGGIATIAWNQLENESHSFSFSAEDKERVALARSHEHLLEILDVLLRLVAVSVVQSVRLFDWSSLRALINAPTLAYLMEQCQSLKVLTLRGLRLDENHCRILGAYSRPGLEIVLILCKITSAGARALAEVLGRNQGPTKLDRCEIDNFVLADGLRGNSRLASLQLTIFRNNEVRDREVLAIAGVLRENKGLVDFNLGNGFSVNDEMWGAICDFLKAHPTLEVLDFRAVSQTVATAAPAVHKSRIQKIVDMLETNVSIHTIYLHSRLCRHELFRESVIPFLETNRFRPRLLAIQRIRPIMYRAKVLGRALLSARTDANRLWMPLSGNAEVVFPSTTATIAAVGNLTTAATAAVTSTSTANVAATALPTSATDSLLTPAAKTAAISAASPSTYSDAFAPTVVAAAATAAGNVAGPSPSTGQKRKARP
jgi:hypothetical protein